jgi:hypothetical protein
MMNTTQPGWYPVNESRELGYHDGTNWTGHRVPNPDAPTRTRNLWATAGFVLLLLVLLAVYAGLDMFLEGMAG